LPIVYFNSTFVRLSVFYFPDAYYCHIYFNSTFVRLSEFSHSPVRTRKYHFNSTFVRLSGCRFSISKTPLMISIQPLFDYQHGRKIILQVPCQFQFNLCSIISVYSIEVDQCYNNFNSTFVRLSAPKPEKLTCFYIISIQPLFDYQLIVPLKVNNLI